MPPASGVFTHDDPKPPNLTPSARPPIICHLISDKWLWRSAFAISGDGQRHGAASLARMDPSEQEQGAFGIGRSALIHDVLVNALTGNIEEAGEIGFFATASQEVASALGQFVPQWGERAGPDGRAAGDTWSAAGLGSQDRFGRSLRRFRESFRQRANQG